MRINFTDVLLKNSLRNTYVDGKKMGYEFKVRLSNYRGHFLSAVDQFEVRTDGERVPDEALRFCLNDKEFTPSQLRECYTEWWDLLTPAVMKVYKKDGLSPGDHDVTLKLMLRVPYMPLPGGDNDHTYMPLDCGDKQVLTIIEP